MSEFLIKICGLSTPDTLETALAAGADMIGFVFHPKSPRYVSLEQAAALATQARGRAQIVALVVDADDATIESIIARLDPDMLQLHGAETPERVAQIQSRFGKPAMKALGVEIRSDLAAVDDFREVAASLLLDAKPPKDATYPGGHGRVFDWGMLDALDPRLSFMLSGGLTAANVGTAIKRVRAAHGNLAGVDVSTGVERARGIKDSALIRDFIREARAAVRDAASGQ